MGAFYRRSKNYAVELSDTERDDEIARLEGEREKIDIEIEDLLSSYARLTRNPAVKKGARRVGDSPKDLSYWNLSGKTGKK